jgi:hypothetical protein
MSGFERIFWYIAMPATVVFVIQTILTLLGVTFDHSDADVHHDGAGDHAYFPIFTVRNLVIFLMMFGWTGIAVIHQFKAGVVLTLIASALAGLMLMFVVALMFYGISRLATSGNVVICQGIAGSDEKVYLKIPAGRSGAGKVTMVVQGVQKELQATTTGAEIPTGAIVKIAALNEDGSVIVTKG